MTGIVGGLDYSALFSTADVSLDLLSTILGGAGTSTTTVATTDPLTALRLAQANSAHKIAAEAKTPEVARDIAAFRKAVAGSKTIQSALANPAVLKVLLTANGLGDQLAYTGLATKALMSDPTSTASLASRISGSNAGWLAVAKTFNFQKNGLSALTGAGVQSTLAAGYAEVRWRESLDASTPGLSSALTFLDQARTITNVDQILGNAVNRNVVLTALSIPLQIAYQPLAAQEKAIATRLDVTKLKDPKYVQALAQRFLLNKQASGTNTSSGIVSLLA